MEEELKIYRRYLEAALFVGLYMTIGWYFHLDANLYLILGIPLTIVFQLFIRRQPIVTLWVKDAAKFELNSRGLIIAFLLAIGAIGLFFKLFSQVPLGQNLWFGVCILGAIPAAFCIRLTNKEKLKDGFYCLTTAGAIGCAIMVVNGLANHIPMTPSLSMIPKFLGNLLALFNVCFVMEEVTFRGVLDSHIYRAGESCSWLSAIFISVLWGLWHFPLTGTQGTTAPLQTAGLLILIHTVIGVPLSLFWRRSGNLAVTSFSHAFIDAFRNMLFQ